MVDDGKVAMTISKDRLMAIKSENPAPPKPAPAARATPPAAAPDKALGAAAAKFGRVKQPESAGFKSSLPDSLADTSTTNTPMDFLSAPPPAGISNEIRLAVDAMVQKIVDTTVAEKRTATRTHEAETWAIRHEPLGQDRLSIRYWWTPGDPCRIWLEPALESRQHWSENVAAFHHCPGSFAEKLAASAAANREALVELPLAMLREVCAILGATFDGQSSPDHLVSQILALDTSGLHQFVALRQTGIEEVRMKLRRASRRDILRVFDTYGIQYCEEMSRSELAEMVDEKNYRLLLDKVDLEQGEASDEEDMKKEIEKERKRKNKVPRKRSHKSMIEACIQSVIDLIPGVEDRPPAVEKVDPDEAGHVDIDALLAAPGKSSKRGGARSGRVKEEKESIAADMDDSDDESVEDLDNTDPSQRRTPWTFLCTLEQLYALLDHLTVSGHRERGLLANIGRIEHILKDTMARGRKVLVSAVHGRKLAGEGRKTNEGTVAKYDPDAKAGPCYTIQHVSGAVTKMPEREILNNLVPEQPLDGLARMRTQQDHRIGSSRSSSRSTPKKTFGDDPDPTEANCGAPRGTTCHRVIRETLLAILEEYISPPGETKKEYVGWKRALAVAKGREELAGKTSELAAFCMTKAKYSRKKKEHIEGGSWDDWFSVWSVFQQVRHFPTY